MIALGPVVAVVWPAGADELQRVLALPGSAERLSRRIEARP